MKLLDNFKNIIEKASKLTRKELETYRFLLILGIVVDMFLIYWYLNLKKLGMLIMVILLIIFAVIVMLHSRTQDDSPPKKEIHNKKPKGGKKPMEKSKPQEEDESYEEENKGFDFGIGNLGLPDADEYNGRLAKALNCWF